MSQDIETPGMWKVLFSAMEQCDSDDSEIDFVLRDINALLLRNQWNCDSLFSISGWENMVIGILAPYQDSQGQIQSEQGQRCLKFIIFICCMLLFNQIHQGLTEWKRSLNLLTSMISTETHENMLYQAIINKTMHTLTNEPECSPSFVKQFSVFSKIVHEFVGLSEYSERETVEKMSNMWEIIAEFQFSWTSFDNASGAAEAEKLCNLERDLWEDSLVFVQICGEDDKSKLSKKFYRAGRKSRSRRNILKKLQK